MPALSPSSTEGIEEEGLLLGLSVLEDEDSVEVVLAGVSLGDSEEVLVGVGDALEEDSVVVDAEVVVSVLVLELEVSVVVVSGVGVADSDSDAVVAAAAPWTEN